MRFGPTSGRSPLLALALAFVLLLFAAGSFFALRLWFHPWAPRVVRMLPAGETLAYLDLEPLRTAGWLDGGGSNVPQLERAPAYADFVRDSGFDFERDLGAVAVSLRGSPTQPEESTCILQGRFTPRFQAYLQSHALRRLSLDGKTGYVFAGWARPQQAITVVPLDANHVLITNTANAAAVAAHARRWWPSASMLWRSRPWSPPPIGYMAMDALRLAAARQIDGSTAPWRGAKELGIRLDAGLDASLTLQGEEQTLSPEDARRARDWAAAEIDALRPLLPENPDGQPTLRALLDRVELRQQGNNVGFDLRLSAATLRQWRQAAAR